MENNSQRLVHLANKNFSEVLKDGFKLFIQNYKTLILPLAFFQVILIILNVFLLTDLNWFIDSLGIDLADTMESLVESTSLTPEELQTLMRYTFLNFAFLFLQNLIGAIIITIAMCSVGNYVFRKYMNENVRFVDSFKSAFNKKIFFAILILGICLPVSFIIYIPAIFIFGFFIFLVFTYNMEVKKNPISEARAIAKGNFWKIIGVFIINILIILTVSQIFISIIDFFLINDSTIPIINSWNDPATRNFGMLILYNIFYNIVDIILAPLFICLLTALFSSLKAKKDLGFQYQQDYQPSRDMYQESYKYLRQEPYESIETEVTAKIPEIRMEGRFYCPFCGSLIQTPKKFCPKCGENLKDIIGN